MPNSRPTLRCQHETSLHHHSHLRPNGKKRPLFLATCLKRFLTANSTCCIKSTDSGARSVPITPTKKATRSSRSASPVPAHDLLEATAFLHHGDGSAPAILEEADAASMLVLEKKEEEPFPIRGLDAPIADNMVENCIGYVVRPNTGVGFRIQNACLILRGLDIATRPYLSYYADSYQTSNIMCLPLVEQDGWSTCRIGA